MQKICYLFLILFVTLFSISANAIESYIDAYNICSPYSNSKARTDCNYGRNFENYYLQCMHANGFADEEIEDPEQYKKYLATYEYCSSVSDQNTKDFCNYGALLKKHYDSCMKTQGYNADGEILSAEQRKFEFDF